MKAAKQVEKQRAIFDCVGEFYEAPHAWTGK